MLITQPWALYNEIDEYAADWLENLIARGLIAPGVVDRRSIVDVRADDLRGFRQCHFFAGIGVWSYALRRSGVSDDTALWTGSPPCQPFSAAGQRGGVDDERHLWPALFHLIGECRPERFFGEQVASKDGLGWLDLVFTDLEKAGYAVAALDTCSAGSGSPHIRQRLRIAAYDLRLAAGGLQHASGDGWEQRWSEPSERGAIGGRGIGGMASGHDDEWGPDLAFRGSEGRAFDGRGGAVGQLGNTERFERIRGRAGQALSEPGALERIERPSDVGGLDDSIGSGLEGLGNGPRTTAGQWKGPLRPVATASGIDWVADTDGGNAGAEWQQRGGEQRQQSQDGGRCFRATPNRTNPTNGFWGDADWLFCRDGKWRPVEPGTFPLVDGASFRLGSGCTFEGKSRQGMLKGYGNAIDAEATIDFLTAYLEAGWVDIELHANPAPLGNAAPELMFDDLLG